MTEEIKKEINLNEKDTLMLLEAPKCNEISMTYQDYPSHVGGKGVAGLELTPVCDMVNRTAILWGEDVKFYIENGRMKGEFIMVSKVGNEKYFNPLFNKIRFWFDIREKGREDFCFVDVENIDFTDVYKGKKCEDGNGRAKMRFVMKGLVQSNNFFHISPTSLRYFKEAGVIVHEMSINKDLDLVDDETRNAIDYLININGKSIGALYRDIKTDIDKVNPEMLKTMNEKQRSLFNYLYYLLYADNNYMVSINNIKGVFK